MHSNNFARVLIHELVKGMSRKRFRFSCRKNALIPQVSFFIERALA